MEHTRRRSAILLIMLIGRSTEVSDTGEFIKPLNIIYLCGPSLETVVNLSAYNLSCDNLIASINNDPVIRLNKFSLPIINSTPGKNFTIHGCHKMEYICFLSLESGYIEKRFIIKGIGNHSNNTDAGIKDSGGHFTDGTENHINNNDKGIKDSGGHVTYGIENHKNNTNKEVKSSRNRFTLGIPVGFMIFIMLVLVIVANRKKIKRWFRRFS